MITRGHLTLLLGGEMVPVAPVTSVSPHRLAASVIAAAQRWAAEVDRAGLPAGADTPEERARRDLMDAVFTMEWHQVAPDAAHRAR
jgi:hypothetical protein